MDGCWKAHKCFASCSSRPFALLLPCLPQATVEGGSKKTGRKSGQGAPQGHLVP